MTENSSPSSPLELLCVGTGRDGTTSLSQMIQQIYDRQGEAKTVGHEWGGMELYRHFCDFKETGDEKCLERIDDLLWSCPHHCVVGNGYASVLPHFARVFGDRLKLIHLQRRDREACAASMARNCELFPGNHLYYAQSDAHSKRMAAFHYGEATREEWDAWPILKKYGWFYDKTHSLIRLYAPLFSQVVHVETEAMAEEKTREVIGKIAGADFVPPGVHVNRHIDTDSLPVESRVWVQRALGKIDLQRLAVDETYGIDHFLHEFAFKASYRMNEVWHQNPEALDEIAKVIDQGRATLKTYSDKLEQLAKDIAEHREKSSQQKESDS